MNINKSDHRGRLKRTGAIFCGGKSSRMGIPKAGIKLSNGLIMVEQVYQALSFVCDEVVLVGHADGVPQYLRHQLQQVVDKTAGRGPLGALEALFETGMNSRYIIAPCDLPYVTSKIFQFLTETQADSAVLKVNGDVQPTVGVYAASTLSVVRQQLEDQDYKMHRFISKIPHTIISVPDALSEALHNANSPQDFVIR